MSRDIPLINIQPDRDQPRKRFDDGALCELADSMRANGLLSPILVRPTGGGAFVIVHGERRFRAARLLNWQTIAATVRDLSAEDARVFAILENVQRENLTPIEEARAYQHLVDAGMTQTEIGAKMGKSQSYIATKLRLLNMPDFLQSMLDAGFVTEGHVKQILRLRKFYNGATVVFDEAMDGKSFDDQSFDDQITLVALIIGWRPAQKWILPDVGFASHPSPKRAELARIVRDYSRTVAAGGVVQVWRIAALWHAVAVAIDELSVAELSDNITLLFEVIAAQPDLDRMRQVAKDAAV